MQENNSRHLTATRNTGDAYKT